MEYLAEPELGITIEISQNGSAWLNRPIALDGIWA